jgi:uncharacterized integral membrane protein
MDENRRAALSKAFDKAVDKAPWGVIASGCAIYVFYALVGLIAAYIVFGKIAEQTNDTVGFLDSWWQVLLFVTVLIFGIVMIGALVMFVLRTIRRRKAPKAAAREYSQSELVELDGQGEPSGAAVDGACSKEGENDVADL